MSSYDYIKSDIYTSGLLTGIVCVSVLTCVWGLPLQLGVAACCWAAAILAAQGSALSLGLSAPLCSSSSGRQCLRHWGLLALGGGVLHCQHPLNRLPLPACPQVPAPQLHSHTHPLCCFAALLQLALHLFLPLLRWAKSWLLWPLSVKNTRPGEGGTWRSSVSKACTQQHPCGGSGCCLLRCWECYWWLT